MWTDFTRQRVLGHHFERAHLERFTVAEDGVTFHHPGFDIPHVALALAPEYAFHYPWPRLERFIKPTGPLAAAKPGAPSGS